MEAFVTLVGTHFRGSDAKRIVNALQLGDDGFTFEREPYNEYDPLAIKVIHSGEHVGYLARASNHNIAAAMDQGCTLYAHMIDREGLKPVLHLVWDADALA